ncbi:hypothetical protein AB0C36_32375, partial [Streptodolium elevatio]
MTNDNWSARTDPELDAILASSGDRVGRWFEQDQEAGLSAVLALTGDAPVPPEPVVTPTLADEKVWSLLCAAGVGPSRTATPTASAGLLVRVAVEVVGAVESLETPTRSDNAEHHDGGRRRVADVSSDEPVDGEAGRIVALVELAQDGDGEAFAQLYDNYLDTVYRYIYY